RQFRRARYCWTRFSPASRWCHRYPCSHRCPWDPWDRAPAGSSRIALPNRSVRECLAAQRCSRRATSPNSETKCRCSFCRARIFHKESAPSGMAVVLWRRADCKSRCAASRHRASGSSLLFSQTAWKDPAALSFAPAHLPRPEELPLPRTGSLFSESFQGPSSSNSLPDSRRQRIVARISHHSIRLYQAAKEVRRLEQRSGVNHRGGWLWRALLGGLIISVVLRFKVALSRYERSLFPNFGQLFEPLPPSSPLFPFARDPQEAFLSVVLENRSEKAITAWPYQRPTLSFGPRICQRLFAAREPENRWSRHGRGGSSSPREPPCAT